MANLFEPPRYIAVEGPIRVGKSTLCKVIAETLHAQRLSEPDSNPFLRPCYRGEPGAAFQAHTKMAHVADFLAKARPMFAKTVMTKAVRKVHPTKR